jgi:hypothetical protein
MLVIEPVTSAAKAANDEAARSVAAAAAVINFFMRFSCVTRGAISTACPPPEKLNAETCPHHGDAWTKEGQFRRTLSRSRD